jgi:glycosyltransferase EpsE
LVAALDAHPEVVVVSSWMSSFDERGVWGMVRTKPFPTREDFLSGSPICHAPCMMRREPVMAVGGYGSQPWVLQVEDLYLWLRLYAAGYKAMNLQEPLYRVRDDQNAQSRRTLPRRLNETRVRWTGFALLGLPWYTRLWAVKPILVWALPEWIYRSVRGKRLKRI